MLGEVASDRAVHLLAFSLAATLAASVTAIDWFPLTHLDEHDIDRLGPLDSQ